MRVTVKLISPLSIMAGRREPFIVELPENATGMELIRILSNQVKGPLLIHRAVLAGGMMLLVNETYTTPDAALKEGDRVSAVLRISGI
jgi:molybdopterin converting factor small subunit